MKKDRFASPKCYTDTLGLLLLASNPLLPRHSNFTVLEPKQGTSLTGRAIS